MTAPGSTALQQLLETAAEAYKDPHRFAEYRDRPVEFARDVLGVRLWSKQKKILRAAVTNRRIAIRSGHSVGKTFTMAVLVIWWLYCRKGLVVTTAPTWEHVEGVLWREINTLCQRARVPLPGVENQTERRIDNTWYAIGLSTTKPSAFQGRHHPDLLVVIDEAPGVSEQVHLEISTLATGERNCIVMVGNPTETSGTFYDAFSQPDIWHLIHVSCLDHPNVRRGKEIIPGAVTRRWVEERRKLWGEKHAFWYARVLGEFPTMSERGVVPLLWAERAQAEGPGDLVEWEKPDGTAEKISRRERALREAKAQRLKPIIALDVARYGSNKCVMGLRYGDGVESIEAWHHTSTMETAGRAKRLWEATGASMVVVDSVGVGGGVVDRLAEQGVPVVAFNSQHRAFTPGQFNNRRSELWWLIRLRLEHERLWYPKTMDNQLVKDLIEPTYKILSSGRLAVQTKEELLDEGKPSPDFADMLVMLFADSSPEQFEEELKAAATQDPQAFEEEHREQLQRDDAPFGQLPAGF